MHTSAMRTVFPTFQRSPVTTPALDPTSSSESHTSNRERRTQLLKLRSRFKKQSTILFFKEVRLFGPSVSSY